MVALQLRRYVAAVLVVAVGSAGYAVAAGRILLPALVVGSAVAPIVLAVSGRLLDPVLACALQDVRAVQAEIELRSGQGSDRDPGRGSDGSRGAR
jgi:hypothetical protein